MWRQFEIRGEKAQRYLWRSGITNRNVKFWVSDSRRQKNDLPLEKDETKDVKKWTYMGIILVLNKDCASDEELICRMTKGKRKYIALCEILFYGKKLPYT